MTISTFFLYLFIGKQLMHKFYKEITHIYRLKE